MKVEEVRIELPWGQMAVKLWGCPSNPPILLIHGYMDNAGSFDRLIPHLPPCYYYICPDLPGHGKSDHLPKYVPIHFIYYMSIIRLVLDHFQRDTYTVIAHSYGAMMAILFAQVYPEYVNKLILIDGVYFTTTSTTLFPRMIHYQHLGYARYIENELKGNTGPQFTYTEALQRFIKNRVVGTITEEAAKNIVDRMLLPSSEEGKFQFSLDVRLKTFNLPYLDYEAVMEFVKDCPVKCPTLLILYTHVDAYKVHFSKLIQYFKKQPECTIEMMDGNHDLHNDQPEVVAPVLNRFLLKKTSKL